MKVFDENVKSGGVRDSHRSLRPQESHPGLGPGPQQAVLRGGAAAVDAGETPANAANKCYL